MPLSVSRLGRYLHNVADQLPTDYTANKGLLGLCCANICLFVLAKLYYMWRNHLIDKDAAGASGSEKARLTGLRFVH